MSHGTSVQPREGAPDAASGPTTRALPPAPDRRLLRERAGLTRAQAAARLGVSTQKLRAWEQGRARPHGRRLEAYASLLAELTTGPTPEGATEGTGEEAPRSGNTGTAEEAPRTGEEPRIGAPGRPADEASRPAEEASRPAEEASRPAPKAARIAQEAARPHDEAVRPAGAPRRAEASSVAPDLAHTAPGALPLPGPPDAAFAVLYARAALPLLRQAYLLTSRPRVALAAVLSGFRQAWERWPEVARDPDPEGWVRAVVHESALSPWRGFGGRGRRVAPADAAQAALAGALLRLPPPHRRVVLLYEGVGLDLPETAAEVEASTPAAAHRLLHARDTLTAQLPELAARPQQLTARLRAFLAEGEVPGRPKPPALEAALTGIRLSGRARTGAALTLSGLLATTTLYAVATTDSTPPPPPAFAVDGTLPPAPGPPHPANPQDRPPADGPGTGPGRLVPLEG
ncbi:helix-turn-helix domain-containing protein [Streptomyces sp. NRRL F-5630]|uniref:helix-turn-helix domain-containing protein n=1 Tax=Streptomyces sp. NRRL F-5630 TaxID=1463864 RepID=UPI003EB92B24